LNRFSETEGIAILTMLVSRYKIEVKEEPQFANESFEAQGESVGGEICYYADVCLLLFFSSVELAKSD
jgi:hypothetical protein